MRLSVCFSAVSTDVFFFLGRRYDRCAMEIDNCKPLAMDFNGIYGGLFAEDTWPPLNGNG